jgi:quinoprotein glucose dehydrogenase
MKFRIVCVMVVAAWAVGVSQLSARAEQGKTTNDGVFTAEQAARGEAAYKAECASCHGGDLGGDGFAPPLAGSDFAANWNDLSVGDFFERIRISMPPSNAASVTPAAKADIVAYVLQQNKYPEGKTEVEPKLEAIKDIKILLKP